MQEVNECMLRIVILEYEGNLFTNWLNDNTTTYFRDNVHLYLCMHIIKHPAFKKDPPVMYTVPPYIY